MTQKEKRMAKLTSRMGESIHLLHIHGLMADGERRKAEARLLKWAERNGVVMKRVNAITGQEVK